jgi:hypothetical protein
VHPGAVIQHDQEGVLVERRKIADHREENLLDVLLMQGERKMMVVHNIVAA